MRSNIILIGMPGAGKSTVGVVLAKLLGYDFVDLDLVIMRRHGQTLQQMLDRHGVEQFLEWESQAAQSLECQRTVIATGGSVVLSRHAMEHLRAMGLVVYLDVPLPELEKRITDLATRGIVFEEGQTLADIYRQRLPLYRRWADRVLPFDACDGGIGALAQSAAEKYLLWEQSRPPIS